MNTTTSSLPDVRERALVLHGGGSAGNAWEIGIIAGLLDAGLDVTDADLIVGTSAGATAAAQITNSSPAELYAAILDTVPPARVGQVGGGRGPGRPPVEHYQRTEEIIAASSDADDMHRRLGAAAVDLDAESDGTWSGQWRATVAARLPGAQWPAQQRVVMTVLNARTGEGVAIGRDSGIDLIDAIAASTSSGMPYRIGDELYLDGGYWRNENAHLAAGYKRVLVLSPFSGRTRHPLEWGMQLTAQIEELEAGGSAVETVFPDEASLAAFGGNMMDLSARKPAAQAAYAEAHSRAEALAAFWR